MPLFRGCICRSSLLFIVSIEALTTPAHVLRELEVNNFLFRDDETPQIVVPYVLCTVYFAHQQVNYWERTARSSQVDANVCSRWTDHLSSWATFANSTARRLFTMVRRDEEQEECDQERRQLLCALHFRCSSACWRSSKTCFFFWSHAKIFPVSNCVNN